MFPLIEPMPILVFNLAAAAVLITMFVLFRRARRETCTWPRWLRVIAQAPAWLLVPLGGWVIVGLAMLEIREKRGGLGIGTIVAAIGALLKGLADRYGRPEES
ncbi:MAG: hypothetical protein DMF88_24125 [Acidobacteria bacterium]|nr:MAG: hypothetical protein DMF88_24125 [Acidobacteriota bacterium]